MKKVLEQWKIFLIMAFSLSLSLLIYLAACNEIIETIIVKFEWQNLIESLKDLKVTRKRERDNTSDVWWKSVGKYVLCIIIIIWNLGRLRHYILLIIWFESYFAILRTHTEIPISLRSKISFPKQNSKWLVPPWQSTASGKS